MKFGVKCGEMFRVPLANSTIISNSFTFPDHLPLFFPVLPLPFFSLLLPLFLSSSFTVNEGMGGARRGRGEGEDGGGGWERHMFQGLGLQIGKISEKCTPRIVTPRAP